MKILDNISNTVRDDLRAEIKRGSRVSVAAACFFHVRISGVKGGVEEAEAGFG